MSNMKTTKQELKDNMKTLVSMIPENIKFSNNTQKEVFALVYYFASKNGWKQFTAGYKQFVEDCGISYKTVSRQLFSLKALGYIDFIPGHTGQNTTFKCLITPDLSTGQNEVGVLDIGTGQNDECPPNNNINNNNKNNLNINNNIKNKNNIDSNANAVEVPLPSDCLIDISIYKNIFDIDIINFFNSIFSNSSVTVEELIRRVCEYHKQIDNLQKQLEQSKSANEELVSKLLDYSSTYGDGKHNTSTNEDFIYHTVTTSNTSMFEEIEDEEEIPF